MAKRGKKRAKVKSKTKSKYHRIKHHGKLLVLLTSKIVILFLAFIIGLFIGYRISEPPLLIFIAGIIGIVLYLLGVLHVVKWLKI